jgi:hypothetical protein
VPTKITSGFKAALEQKAMYYKLLIASRAVADFNTASPAN